MKHDILIVDDERDIRRALADVLEDEGYQARTASDPDSADAAVAEQVPSLVILDIWFRGARRDGVDLLRDYVAHHPFMPIIMISGHGTITTAVKCTRIGAYDFIEKPLQSDKVLLVVKRALDEARLRRENEELRRSTRVLDDLVGESRAMVQLREAISRVAPTGSRVLITGPAGSGKELVARHIHQQSPRTGGPFVAINAATMEPERVEEELFGRETRTSPGVPVITHGVFERANGGTLFLDNIPDMPLATQGKILRALQEQVFTRLGGDTPIRADVRVLTSASGNITAAVQSGQFREDLYYRLNVVSIDVPPLSERREDVAPLSQYFIRRAVRQQGLSARTLTGDAEMALLMANWPGNVRQLRNVIESLLIMTPEGRDGAITADMLPGEVRQTSPAPVLFHDSSEVMSLGLREARAAFERKYLLTQLARFGNNISRTAAAVGMERSALHRKLRALGVSVTERDTGG